jgi:hypothetical protein
MVKCPGHGFDHNFGSAITYPGVEPGDVEPPGRQPLLHMIEKFYGVQLGRTEKQG